jgi:hypothetical protein
VLTFQNELSIADINKIYEIAEGLGLGGFTKTPDNNDIFLVININLCYTQVALECGESGTTYP